MSNQVHLVIKRRSTALENVLRDLKKHTSNKILKAIAEKPKRMDALDVRTGRKEKCK